MHPNRDDLLSLYRALLPRTAQRRYDYATLLADIYLHRWTMAQTARHHKCSVETIKSAIRKLHRETRNESIRNDLESTYWHQPRCRYVIAITDALFNQHPVDVVLDQLVSEFHRWKNELIRMDRAYSNPKRRIPP